MNSPYASILLIAVLVLLMYFVVLRPQRKRQQKQAETMRTIEPGTRVMLTSGIYGTISHVGEKQMVVETSPGVELTVLKQAVAKVVPPGEEDADAPVELDSDDSYGTTDEYAEQSAGQQVGEQADADPYAPVEYRPDEFDAHGDTVRTAGTEATATPEDGAVARSAYEDSTAPTWPPVEHHETTGRTDTTAEGSESTDQPPHSTTSSTSTPPSNHKD